MKVEWVSVWLTGCIKWVIEDPGVARGNEDDLCIAEGTGAGAIIIPLLGLVGGNLPGSTSLWNDLYSTELHNV